jgi:hypothetical protein
MSNVEFTNVLEELTELHNLKNQDYATSENPYKNLQGVERIGLEAWKGVVIRMMDKFSRLEEFCVKEELAVKDETIEDTFKDIAIYSVLAMILYRKRMEGKSNDPDITDWRFLATILKKRKELEQELIENERGKGSDECRRLEGDWEPPTYPDRPEWELPEPKSHPSLFPVDDKYSAEKQQEREDTERLRETLQIREDIKEEERLRKTLNLDAQKESVLKEKKRLNTILNQMEDDEKAFYKSKIKNAKDN